ncbi:MAG TPA: GNAT family N-acetyltransferase [Galbitalea sp.]|jgi:L-amino acid N-acyltransferase YncA|nr:GNAT family N-acetyltransferase [Galbitalea sp.]
MEIREFRESDWASVWPIYQSVVDAGETYTYDPNWSEQQAHDVWVEPAPGRTFVALDGDRVVGTAHVGPNKPARGSHVATASFMVSADARGLGVGRALGSHVLESARADGYASMQFNAVVETNSGAVKLWQELGFRIIGTVPEAFEHPTHGRVGLHIMYRQL